MELDSLTLSDAEEEQGICGMRTAAVGHSSSKLEVVCQQLSIPAVLS